MFISTYLVCIWIGKMSNKLLVLTCTVWDVVLLKKKKLNKIQ